MRPFLIIVHSIWNSLYKTRYFKEFPLVLRAKQKFTNTSERYMWNLQMKVVSQMYFVCLLRKNMGSSKWDDE